MATSGLSQDVPPAVPLGLDRFVGEVVPNVSSKLARTLISANPLLGQRLENDRLHVAVDRALAGTDAPP